MIAQWFHKTFFALPSGEDLRRKHLDDAMRALATSEIELDRAQYTYDLVCEKLRLMEHSAAVREGLVVRHDTKNELLLAQHDAEQALTQAELEVSMLQRRIERLRNTLGYDRLEPALEAT